MWEADLKCLLSGIDDLSVVPFYKWKAVGFQKLKRQEKTIAVGEENYHEEWTITSFTELTHASLDTSEFMNMISTSKVIIKKKTINNLDFDKFMKS